MLTPTLADSGQRTIGCPNTPGSMRIEEGRSHVASCAQIANFAAWCPATKSDRLLSDLARPSCSHSWGCNDSTKDDQSPTGTQLMTASD